MTRRVLAVMVVAALALVVAARADDEAKPAPKSDSLPPEVLLKQEQAYREYEEFKNALLDLAQRLKKSSKAEDKERAAILLAAIKKAEDAAIESKFDTLIKTLKTSTSPSLQDLRESMKQNQTLAEDIRSILAILLTDSRDLQLKEEIRRVSELIKMLDKLIGQEKNLRAQAEMGRVDPADLAKKQAKLTEDAKAIAKAMTKKGEGEDSKGKGKGQAEGEGEGKGKGKGEGEGKGKGKGQGEGEGKGKGQGQGQQGQQGQPKPNDQQSDSLPGREQVQDAIKNLKRAEEELKKKRNDNASKEMDEAIAKLEKARKRLEDLLKQLREEEKERLLAALQNRCENMLAMQEAVYEDTVRLDRAIGRNPDKKPTRNDEQKSDGLAKREDLIVIEANKAIRLLEEEGSAIAFAEVFRQVRDDMMNVARRLRKTDTGALTQQIEKDIIASLKDMIEALKKAQQKLQDQKNGQPPPNTPGDKNLIDLLAELKMIRAMQIRVNGRTKAYADQYPGKEQTPEIQTDLRGLSEREKKIFQVTKDLSQGKNKGQ